VPNGVNRAGGVCGQNMPFPVLAGDFDVAAGHQKKCLVQLPDQHLFFSYAIVSERESNESHTDIEEVVT
jgi:hypothetical protein